MAHQALERPNLYEEDYLAWIEEQIAHLRAGRWHAVDVPHMLEELECMAGRQRRELYDRLVVLLTHMLKRDRRPDKPSRSWEATIVEQRRQLRKLLEESPSLKSRLNATALEAYEDAVEQAAAETGAPEEAFPESLPYTLDQILERPSKRGRR